MALEIDSIIVPAEKIADMAQVKSMHHNLRSKYLVEFIGNCILIGLLLAFINYIYYYQPVAYVFLTAEDSWGEYATFLYWLFTSFVLLWALIRYQDLRKPGHFVFAMVAFLIAMEEISWGQRIFNIETPEFFLVNNYQSELSFHNFDLIRPINSYIGRIILSGTIVLPVLTWFSIRLRDLCVRLGIPIVSVRHWPFFVLPAYFLDFLYLHQSYNYNKSDEIAELLLAIAFSVMTLDWVLKFMMGQKAYGYKALKATICMIFLVWIFVVPLVHYSLGDLQYCFSTESKISLPQAGRYRQADLLFTYMNQHQKYLEEDSSYYHGLVLMKLGRNKDAYAILKKALKKQELRKQGDPGDPDVHRDIGKLLNVLDQKTEAKQAFLKAEELDRKRLTEVLDPETEAIFRWSLGKTLFALGRREAAIEQIQRAANTTALGLLREEIIEWFENEEKIVVHLLPLEKPSIDAETTRTTREGKRGG